MLSLLNSSHFKFTIYLKKHIVCEGSVESNEKPTYY